MKLKNKRVAILTEEGFEESELTSPLQALKDEGAQVDIVSPRTGVVRGWKGDNWGKEVKVDVHIDDANPDDYRGVVLPGGVANPDLLRRSKKAVQFVKKMMEDGKPVASICHGPQTLIETGLLKGRKMTSFASIATDLKNAGVEWVDEEVVVDQGLVTSRKPDDLPAFNRKMVEELCEGVHEEAKVD